LRGRGRRQIKKKKFMPKMFMFHFSHPHLAYIHEDRFNGLIPLVILAIAVSVTVFALSKPK
jgi:hypothetical protein